VQHGQGFNLSLRVPERWSVYDIEDLTVEVADKLYEIGFHDTTQSTFSRERSVSRSIWGSALEESTLRWKVKLRLISWLFQRADAEGLPLRRPQDPDEVL
jgi:hypothetical protein